MSLNIRLLEQSFDLVKSHGMDFVSSFYDNLFADYPEVRPLFTRAEPNEQKKKLLGSLALVVANLRNPTVLADALRGLGARHVSYGVSPAHYPIVGSTLLKTFAQFLGEDWTPEVRQAWIDAYTAIVQLMLEGTEKPAEVAQPRGPAVS